MNLPDINDVQFAHLSRFVIPKKVNGYVSDSQNNA